MNLVRNPSGASRMRKAAITALAALGLTVGVVGSASATTLPLTGSLSCGITGTMSLKSGSTGMPATPTTHWTIGKVHQQAIDTCNTSGVMGGRAPITGGVITINSRINQGASCATLLASLSSVNKAVLIVKLTNTVTTTEIDPTTGLPVIDPTTGLPVTTSQTRTVAVVRAKDPTVMQSGNGFHITGTVQQSAAGNKPFGGDVFEAQVNVDNSADVAACNSMTSVPLTQVNFSTAGGSSISIHP